LSSFFCERTAEYALVPLLQRSLELSFGAAIPIFYWRSREGNQLSSSVHRGHEIRVLAMFSRRPKATHRRKLIGGNINSELFEFSQAARAHGIVSIAGFPAVESIYNLYSNPSIYWLPLDSTRDSDFEFTVDLLEPIPKPIGSDGIELQTLSLPFIIEQVRDCSRLLAWDDAMEFISELRSKCFRKTPLSIFAGFGGYKPVYFLMSRNG
jgi:hypothetical protein